MKKIVGVGLAVVALIVGFLFIQNAGAHGPMMGRGSWGQPSTLELGAYCPWNNLGYRSSDYSGYQGGYGRGGCWMMNQGWGPGYRGNQNPSNPQVSPQPPQRQ